jgi:hypothetical protein
LDSAHPLRLSRRVDRPGGLIAVANSDARLPGTAPEEALSMASLKLVAHPLLNGIALIIAVAAVMIWSARLEHRVSGLEASVQMLAATPAASAAARAPMSAQEACANLAVRVADAMQKPDAGRADTLRGLLRDAGCPAASNRR